MNQFLNDTRAEIICAALTFHAIVAKPFTKLVDNNEKHRYWIF